MISARLALISVLLVILASCEAVFTYSPLAFLQRDPDNLPTDQKIIYGENALASGDREAIRKAYGAIEDELESGGLDAGTETELRVLAMDLALEAGGVLEAALDLAAYAQTDGDTLSEEEMIERLDLALETIVDLPYVNASLEQLEAAQDAGVPVTGTQLVLAGLGDVCRVASAENGFSDLEDRAAADPELDAELSSAFQRVTDGIARLEAEGVASDLLDGITDMLESVGYDGGLP